MERSVIVYLQDKTKKRVHKLLLEVKKNSFGIHLDVTEARWIIDASEREIVLETQSGPDTFFKEQKAVFRRKNPKKKV
ncbi:hypothetical protein ACJX0J_022787, partial [Zea mays]